MNGSIPEPATTGFAIVVADKNSNLISWGLGTPPHWITDAAGAEAWALALVLKMCPLAPKIITDCKGLLAEAAESAKNCSGKKKLARTWNHIKEACDGNTAQLAESRRLDWMPAHKSFASVGVLEKASGKHVTAFDWRANNLVDHLARQAAETYAPPKKIVRLVKDAVDMVKCAAAKLGLVTWSANNYSTTEALPDGSVRNITKRDASDPPAIRRKKRSKPTRAKKRNEEPADLPTRPVMRTVPGRKHTSVKTRIANKRAATNREKLRQNKALLNAIASIAGGDGVQQCKKKPRKRSAAPSSCPAGARMIIGVTTVANQTPPSDDCSSDSSSNIPAPPSGEVLAQQPRTARTPSEEPVLNCQPACLPAQGVQPTCASSSVDTPQNSSQHVHGFFAEGDVLSQGSETGTLATGESLDDLLELASLEADGVPVSWPPGLTAEVLLRLRERSK